MTSADPLLAAAVLLASQPDQGWRRLQTEHVPDSGGACRACRGAASGAAPTWPCRLTVIARHAERLSATAPRPTGG